jgi:hypothetical protein
VATKYRYLKLIRTSLEIRIAGWHFIYFLGIIQKEFWSKANPMVAVCGANFHVRETGDWSIDMYVRKTLHKVSTLVNKGYGFFHFLSEFLDDFYSAPTDVKAALIEETPEDMPDPTNVPYMAATAHKLANDYGLVPPCWVFEKRCYLPGDMPYVVGCVTGPLRVHYYFYSPPEFKHRNIFTSENTLSRC